MIGLEQGSAGRPVFRKEGIKFLWGLRGINVLDKQIAVVVIHLVLAEDR